MDSSHWSVCKRFGSVAATSRCQDTAPAAQPHLRPLAIKAVGEGLLAAKTYGVSLRGSEQVGGDRQGWRAACLEVETPAHRMVNRSLILSQLWATMLSRQASKQRQNKPDRLCAT